MAERARSPVEVLYSIMQSAESKLGGGEGVEGIYGSITASGMQKILDSLHRSCGLGPASALVDIGAGLGRPLLHAMASHGVRRMYGVELDSIKVSKAVAFVDCTLAALAARGAAELVPGARPRFTCAPVEKMATLEPATHAYSFWEGVPEGGRRAFGRLFQEARSLQAVAVVQRAVRGTPPGVVMESLGFGKLMLISTFPVAMSGSGRSFTAYVFSKIPAASLRALHPTPPLPRRGTGPSPSAAAAAAAAGASPPTRDTGGSAGGGPAEGGGGGGAAPGSGPSVAERHTERVRQRLARGMVLLLTEEAQGSPVKRQPGGCQGADADNESSPSKKARAGGAPAAPSPGGASQASALSSASGYSLRPRRLYAGAAAAASAAAASSSSSISSSGSGGGGARSGRARRDAVAAPAAAAAEGAPAPTLSAGSLESEAAAAAAAAVEDVASEGDVGGDPGHWATPPTGQRAQQGAAQPHGRDDGDGDAGAPSAPAAEPAAAPARSGRGRAAGASAAAKGAAAATGGARTAGRRGGAAAGDRAGRSEVLPPVSSVSAAAVAPQAPPKAAAAPGRSAAARLGQATVAHAFRQRKVIRAGPLAAPADVPEAPPPRGVK